VPLFHAADRIDDSWRTRLALAVGIEQTKHMLKMCDENRLKLQDEINKQGEVVRKLKTTQGSKDKVSIGDFAV
jgi:hypothetical protein